jgi:MHS family shikimate/dehydroshikimate transporter-like MFS transporter
VFEKLKKEKDITKTPLIDVLIKEPKSLLIGIGLKITEVTWAYLLTVFCVIYAVNNLGFVRSDIMDAVLLASAINVIAIPFFGYLSDIVGRRIIYIVGAVLTIFLSYPIFALFESGYIMISIVTGMILGNALMMAPLAAYLPELFRSNVRFTGASVGCQLAAAIGGGVVPIIATVLAVTYNSLTGVALLMVALGAITLVSALFAKKAF